MTKPKTWQQLLESFPREPAKTVYGIAFTARSGSTWLGEILMKSGVLGDPKEFFNQEAARYAISQSAASDVHEYYQHIKTVRQTDGVFGFEMTYQHLNKLKEEGYEQLLDDVGTWFLLRRRDYIAQAVSLYRASQSGIFHSYQKTGEVLEVPYDGDKIARFALSAMASEYNLQRFFELNSVNPTEIWYEELTGMATSEIVDIFVRTIGLTPSTQKMEAIKNIEPSLQRMSDDHSSSLIDQFRAEHKSFVSYWDEKRGKSTVPQFMTTHPSYVLSARAMQAKRADG